MIPTGRMQSGRGREGHVELVGKKRKPGSGESDWDATREVWEGGAGGAWAPTKRKARVKYPRPPR